MSSKKLFCHLSSPFNLKHSTTYHDTTTSNLIYNIVDRTAICFHASLFATVVRATLHKVSYLLYIYLYNVLTFLFGCHFIVYHLLSKSSLTVLTINSLPLIHNFRFNSFIPPPFVHFASNAILFYILVFMVYMLRNYYAILGPVPIMEIVSVDDNCQFLNSFHMYSSEPQLASFLQQFDRGRHDC